MMESPPVVSRAILQVVTACSVIVGAGITYLLHPAALSSALGAAAVLLGVLLALAPDEPMPTTCLVLLMTQFATTFSSLPHLERIWAPLEIAGICFLVHSGAELLRVIDRHSLIEKEVLVRSARRAGAVILLASVVGVVMTTLSSVGRPPGWMLVVTIGGAIAVMLAFANWLGHDDQRAPEREPGDSRLRHRMTKTR
jgi:hypothetical protein